MRHMTSGAGNDIERATDIARRMVCEFGMSSLGPVAFRRPSSRLGRRPGRRVQRGDGSPGGRGGPELVMRGYETARQVLEMHRPAVRALARELLAHESLDASEYPGRPGRVGPARGGPAVDAGTHERLILCPTGTRAQGAHVRGACRCSARCTVHHGRTAVRAVRCAVVRGVRRVRGAHGAPCAGCAPNGPGAHGARGAAGAIGLGAGRRCAKVRGCAGCAGCAGARVRGCAGCGCGCRAPGGRVVPGSRSAPAPTTRFRSSQAHGAPAHRAPRAWRTMRTSGRLGRTARPPRTGHRTPRMVHRAPCALHLDAPCTAHRAHGSPSG